MTDRRLLRSNGRVAHLSLQGQVAAERFVQGRMHRVTGTKAALLDRPGGGRERELLYGQGFTVLEEEGGHAFGFAERDGYVGYIAADRLTPRDAPPTHLVHVRQTWAKAAPDLKAGDEAMPLCHGSQVRLTGADGAWARIDGGAWVPAVHLAPIDARAADPVAVAETYLGAPYLWGGNSSLGIDCSGLVQAACLACGIACPGDSDQQEAELGQALPADAELTRGDLLFWKGHVALVVDDARMIHANAHHMAVAYEGMTEAIARIGAQGGGGVTARRRLLR